MKGKRKANGIIDGKEKGKEDEKERGTL